MDWKLPFLAATLTIFQPLNAVASPIAAAPCATGASIERGTEAMQPLLPSETWRAHGVVLLDCIVQSDRKLRCSAPNQNAPQYDLRPAALAFAGELQVCPGTQRHLMFPLVFRPDESVTPSPSP